MIDSIMKLSDAPIETRLKVMEIVPPNNSKKRLNSIGLHVNDFLVRLNTVAWGPVLIENISNSMSKIALGRGIADNIIVSVEA
jgi:Fe2+ transport system protein FeoA